MQHNDFVIRVRASYAARNHAIYLSPAHCLSFIQQAVEMSYASDLYQPDRDKMAALCYVTAPDLPEFRMSEILILSSIPGEACQQISLENTKSRSYLSERGPDI